MPHLRSLPDSSTLFHTNKSALTSLPHKQLANTISQSQPADIPSNIKLHVPFHFAHSNLMPFIPLPR
eukprot:528180-Hanusia_phi.AAC.1